MDCENIKFSGHAITRMFANGLSGNRKLWKLSW